MVVHAKSIGTRIWKAFRQRLYGVIVVHPLGALRIFVTGLGVDEIVRRPLFLCGWAEHRENWETNGLHWQGWRPIVGEYRETNVTIAVDVRMLWNWLTHESYWRRIERITFVELKLQLECLAFVEWTFGCIDLHEPPKKINQLSRISITHPWYSRLTHWCSLLCFLRLFVVLELVSISVTWVLFANVSARGTKENW